MQLYCISGDNCFLSRSSFIVFVSQIIRLPRNPAKLPENPRVGGSIPPLATIIHKAFSFLVVSIFSFGEHNITASPPQYFTEEVFVPCARPCCAWGGAGRPT